MSYSHQSKYNSNNSNNSVSLNTIETLCQLETICKQVCIQLLALIFPSKRKVSVRLLKQLAMDTSRVIRIHRNY